MRFLDSIRSLFRKKQQNDDMPYSIVMLLRSPFAMTQEVLEAAASRAYGVPYDGSNEQYFVVQNPAITIVKADANVLSVLQMPEPYMGDPQQVSQGFRNADAAKAWSEHRSWAAFDLRSSPSSEKEIYRFLSALVTQLLDTRCAGIYLPKPSDFWIESDGTAAECLRKLSQ